MESHAIPPDFDYSKVHGLKKEAIVRLNEIRPTTLGQAARIQGVTPAEVSLLAVMLRKGADRMTAERSETDDWKQPEG